jgi:CheY-like chemotaxis protein
MESTPHIAIVDDHKDIRELVGRYLGQHGCRVSAADSAATCATCSSAARRTWWCSTS